MSEAPLTRRILPVLGLGLLALGLRLAVLPAVQPGPSPEESWAVGTISTIGGSLPIPADPSLSDAWITLLAGLDRFTTTPVVTVGTAPDVAPDPDPLLRLGRLLAIGLGVLAVALTAAAAGRRGGTAGAWIAGGLLAASPLALSLSLAGSAGSLQMLLAAGLTWALVAGRGIGAGLFGGAAAAAGGGGAGLLAGPPVARIASPAVWIAAVLLLGALAPGVVPGFPVLPAGGPAPDAAGSSPLWVALTMLAGGVGLPGLILAAIAAARFLRSDDRIGRSVVAATGFALALALIRRGAEPSAIAVALPGLALLATEEMLRWIRTGDRARSRLLVGVALLFPLLGLGRAVAQHWTPSAGESADAWVREHVPTGATMLVEPGDLRLPTAEGARQLAVLVQEGRLTEEWLRDYLAPGKTFSPMPLVPDGATEPMEPALFYDPNLAHRFQWMILADLPDEESSEETAEVRTARRLFHEYFRAAWIEEAHLPAGPGEQSGLTVLRRPDGFELDRETLGKLGFVLTRRPMLQLRERSRAFTEWALASGQVFLEAGDNASARAYLGMARERDPEDVETRFRFALALALQGERDRAKEELLYGLSLDPYHGGIHYQLGVLLEEEGDLEGAEVEYRAAIEHQIDPQFARASLGGLLLRRGDTAGAREQLDLLRRDHRDTESTRYLEGILAGS